MTIQNSVFWDVTMFGPCRNRHFGGTYRLHHQDDKNRRAVTNNRSTLLVYHRSVLWLLVTANVVPSLPILVTLMIETICSSETRFLQEPHGAASQKRKFFLVTTVKTSNLTNIVIFWTVMTCNLVERWNGTELLSVATGDILLYIV
jgi:hypothetical protein